MKRIFNIVMVVLLGFIAASCEQPAFNPVYNPADAVAPVLSEIQAEYTLEDGGAFDTFTFSKAEFGIPVAVKYTVYVALAGTDFAKSKTLETVTSNTNGITVSANKLNTALISLGAVGNVAADVEFKIIAQWMGESNAVGIDLTSNVITSTVTPFVQEKEYAKVWVLGGYNGWSHAKAQYLYSYREDDINYEGIVDFGENSTDPASDHATQGFKITGTDNWNTADLNWGMTADDPSAENAATLQLIRGDVGQNITKYKTYRYYRFAINTNTLVLTMKQAFNKIGVIGDFNTWGGDVDMTWNPYYSRFYADVEFAADGGFKFRTDADWAVNYGDNGADGALDMGGDNIAVTAGKYRVYLYFNDSNAYTYYLDDAAYGTEEPTEPEPEPEPEPVVENAWSLIGAIAGSTWDKDFYMTEADGVWTSDVVNITGEFKIRFNNDWAVNRGGALVSLGEPFAVTQDGSNIVVPAAGYYKVVYNSTNEVITVTSYANHFSLIGEIAGTAWDTDFFMEETATGVWKSENVAINGGFKVRYNCDWGVNYGAGGDVEPFVVTLGEAFAAVAGGKNLGVPTANAEYYVTYNDNDKTIMVEAALPSNQWSLIGGIEGTGWDKDFYMKHYASGIWVSDPVTVTGEFKVRYNNDWGINRGGALVSTGAAFAVTQDGSNVVVPAVNVKYQIVYNPAMETITVNPCADAWSVIGGFETYSWDGDLYLSDKGNGVYESEVFQGNGDVKIRFNGGWDVNRGGDMDTLSKAFAVTNNGSNIKLPSTGAFYKLVYDSKAETITVKAAWSLIGQVEGSGWDKDFVMTETASGVWETSAIVNGEFKIRNHCSWDVNRGGDLVTLGTAFAVTPGGPNIKVPTVDAKYKVVYKAAEETVTVTAQ